MAYPKLSLLGLPEELRVNIYEHLFTLESSPENYPKQIAAGRCPLIFCATTNLLSTGNSSYRADDEDYNQWQMAAAFLRTCRLIRDDATKTLYKRLSFSIQIVPYEGSNSSSRVLGKCRDCEFLRRIKDVDINSNLFVKESWNHRFQIANVYELLTHLSCPREQTRLNIGVEEPSFRMEVYEFIKSEWRYDVRPRFSDLVNRCDLEVWCPNIREL
jgi:hypothetical protein